MNAWKAVLALLLVGAAVGLGLGFLIGWGIWPVEYYDTDPVDLKEEHKEEYIVLVSAAYALNGDLEQAEDRLAKLEEEDVAQVVADLAQTYLQEGRDTTTTRNLVMLAGALGSASELMLAYGATPTLAPTFTPTATEVPTATPTEIPTSTPVQPTSTSRPLPPSPTSTPVPPTNTPQPPTSTPQEAAPTSTSAPPTSTPIDSPATETPTATKQAVAGCPERPGVLIRDIAAQPRDWAWVQEMFGAVGIVHTPSCPGGAVYGVVTLWESYSHSIRVTVLDRNGNPKVNVPVAFFGFPEEGVVDTSGACRPSAHIVYTNERGEATYTMGSGSAYSPDLGEAGYHAVWVMDGMPSDCVQGLGWVNLTNHAHADVTFREIG